MSNDPWPPTFTLDQERVLNLLIGDRFYSDASASLREAVLNAVDAVYRRRHREPGAKARIEVTFDRSDLRLTIADNGDGMDRTAVSELFAKVGASAARLQTGGTSVGEFGIGVISYFMAGDTFEVQTWAGGDAEPVALTFRKQMIAGEAATECPVNRTTQGTTVEIVLRDEATFNLLVQAFPKWCRTVDGLQARLKPGEEQIAQGGARRPVGISDLTLPDWVEAASLAPVSTPSGWDTMSGESTVSVLYRGVFVQELRIQHLWGIEGSLDVDPKKFRPRLNRESFVGGEFQTEVEGFLRSVHPRMLREMAERIKQSVARGDLDKWTQRRWATLWLSIPRDESYKAAADVWDSVFRSLPAFEVALGDDWSPISLNDLLTMSPPIYVAPSGEEQPRQGDVVKAAIRLLRHTGHSVVRGFRRDGSWLKGAGNYFNNTSDLIASVFASELPPLVTVASEAERILAAIASRARLFAGTPPVELVGLGEDSPPILRLQDRLVVNIEHSVGRLIVQDVLTENSGPWSLIAITARRSYEHLSQVAAAVRDANPSDEKIGLVKRRYLRGLIS